MNYENLKPIEIFEDDDKKTQIFEINGDTVEVVLTEEKEGAKEWIRATGIINGKEEYIRINTGPLAKLVEQFGEEIKAEFERMVTIEWLKNYVALTNQK